MAATEIEDLAALVGIEILPAVTCEDPDGNVACNSEETIQQTQTEAETKPGTKEAAASGSSVKVQEGGMEDKLSALEEEFANRYTPLDTEFVHTLATSALPPPCVAPWWSNDRGHDRSRGGRGQGWGRGHSRGRGHYHDNQQHHRDRWDNSQGRGYQSHRYHDDRRDSYRDRTPHRHRDRSPVRRDRY